MGRARGQRLAFCSGTVRRWRRHAPVESQGRRLKGGREIHCKGSEIEKDMEKPRWRREVEAARESCRDAAIILPQGDSHMRIMVRVICDSLEVIQQIITLITGLLLWSGCWKRSRLLGLS